MGTIRDTKPYRILSLDGGGTWALIQAKVLMDIYGADCTGHKILADFNLVTANSGGGIVAAGLIADMTPDEILAIFRDEQLRKKIFVELPFYKKLLRLCGIGPQFSTDEKLHGLAEALTGIASNALQKISIPNRNGDAVRFIFTAYDYDRDRATFFRSDPDSPAANFPKKTSPISVIQAVHVSSTAPVQFFDQPATFGDRRYWDGGVAGLNNPVLAAVIESIAYGVLREDIGVLSIGTGNTFLPMDGSAKSSELLQTKPDQGIKNDIVKLAKAILADPPDTDTFIAYVMLNGQLPQSPDELPYVSTPIARLNPLIRPEILGGQWVLPTGFSLSQYQKLAQMDLAVIDPNDVLLIDQFCNGWMMDQWPNQPIRHGSDTVGGLPNSNFCEIGHSHYVAGKAAW